ncbi:MAG: hypothetical protein JW969_06055 [Spirochaetales bacterium]|nr:hypothetical protein [Spirochaetales bacterium]
MKSDTRTEELNNTGDLSKSNEYMRTNKLLDDLNVYAADLLTNMGYEAYSLIRSNVTGHRNM